MKFTEILLESPTDVVARFYKEASDKVDYYFNPEDVKYKEKNAEYYKKYFGNWFDEEKPVVFTKPVTRPQPEFTNKPHDGQLQSPGYRGLQYTLAACDLPYNHKVQRYSPGMDNVAAEAMDDIRASNDG